MSGPRSISAPAGAGLLLAAFAALCWHGLAWDSPTVDEFAHLPAGYYSLETGRFDLYPLNPPLIKVLSALPLLALAPRLDHGAHVVNTGWYPWVFATRFMEENRAAFDRIFTCGRLPIVALGLLMGLLVYTWARQLYGDAGGLVALCFYAFCPSIVAHSHLATVDAGHAALLIAALYSFDRFLRRPGVGRLALCGAALGLAQLAKFTALLLYPLLILLAAVSLAAGGSSWRRTASGDQSAGGVPGAPAGARATSWRETGRMGASLAAIFLVSLLVLDAGYLFAGVGRPAASFRFESHALRGLAAALPAGLPLPLPTPYLQGVDSLQLINETGEFPTYLCGHWYRRPPLAYYPLTLLFKTPLPLLAAWLAAPFARRRRGEDGGAGAAGPARRETAVWLPMLVLLAVFSLVSSVGYGIRYLLPVLPLACVFCGRLVPWLRGRRRVWLAAGLAVILAYPFSILLATPDTIDYFNFLAGGRGDRILLDSNLDWGQGLKRLRAYIDRERLDSVALAYFGHVDPAIYGIRWRFPHPSRPGPAAVSANFLHGYPYVTYAGGRIVPIPPGAFSWLESYPRAADLGGGIDVYTIPLATPASAAGPGHGSQRR